MTQLQNKRLKKTHIISRWIHKVMGCFVANAPRNDGNYCHDQSHTLLRHCERSEAIQRRRFSLLSATLLFCLSGCMGVYDGGFECPPGTGVPCKSISEVNAMVSQDVLPHLHPEGSSCKENACSFEDLPVSPDTPHIWWNPALFQDMQPPPSLSIKGSV